ncbi:MAG: extracellular solute-binding protein [Thermoflexales bacterium]|nr:extracellular solute-binding protein [Thermoflexales bacterium]
MSDLEFSVMAHGPTTADDLRPILAKFEAEHRVKIKLRVFTWETGWTETMKFALYGHGPDVSEIGSTWVGTLAATGTVRPFGIREIAAVGGRFAFLHPSWQSGYLSGQPEMWAMPWLGNVRFVFYRHDLFQQAGIDATTAFRTSAQFMQTLTRLQDAGVSVPLVIPTSNSLNTLHTVAPWVWGAGGNFIEPTAKHTIFNTAEARSGFRAYYDLHRYLAPAAQRLDTEQSDQFFLTGGAAVTISDPGLLNTLLKNPPAAPITIRTALPPGIPFVGGSNLIVWRHSPNHKLAVELVRFLISQQNQITYSQRARSLPVRLDALTGRPFATDALFQPAVEGLKLGRSYPTSRLWGLMEEKLVAELNEVWAELFARPELDLDRALDDHFRPLGARLDAILAADTRK